MDELQHDCAFGKFFLKKKEDFIKDFIKQICICFFFLFLFMILSLMIIWAILGDNYDDKSSLIIGGCVHIFSVSLFLPDKTIPSTHRIRRNSPQGEYVVVGNKSCSLFLANKTVLKVVARPLTSRHLGHSLK